MKKLAAVVLMWASWMLILVTASAQTIAPQESRSRVISDQDLDLCGKTFAQKESN